MKIINVTHTFSRRSLFRITLPKKIIESLSLSSNDIVTFIEKDGKKVLRKMKMDEQVATRSLDQSH